MANDLQNPRKPVHSRCYGIEIECYFPSGSGPLLGYEGFWFNHLDGSITTVYGHRGLEMTSQPLPYAWLYKEIGKQEKRHGRWADGGSCGIHVHVTKKSVSEKKLVELLLILRTLDARQEEKLFGRTSNSYSNPRRTDRYCSINMCPTHTVEFRMFKSGDAKWAQECLRRTKLMVEYKGKWSYENLCKLFGV